MRRSLAVLLLAPVLGCSTASVRSDAPGERPSRRTTIAEVLHSSVRVHVLTGTTVARAATGVVVRTSAPGAAPVSYVVTNEHVVTRDQLTDVTYQVLVDTKDGTTRYPAQVVAEGAVPKMDLAVLEVRGVRLAPATLATDAEIALGDDVVVVGAPYGKGLSLSHGMLSQVEASGGMPSMLKTDAPIGYGASGGGLFDLRSGHLLGVVEGYRTAQVHIPGESGGPGWSFDVPMPGETFASSAAKVRQFVDAHLDHAQAQPAVAQRP